MILLVDRRDRGRHVCLTGIRQPGVSETVGKAFVRTGKAIYRSGGTSSGHRGGEGDVGGDGPAAEMWRTGEGGVGVVRGRTEFRWHDRGSSDLLMKWRGDAASKSDTRGTVRLLL